MDVRNSIDGSLQISNEVVAKIAKLAALEIDGVADVSSGSMQSVRGLLSKASLQKPVTVDLSDGVAVVQVHVIAKYGSKIMPVCAKVQEDHPEYDRHYGFPCGCDRCRAGRACRRPA